MIAGLASSTIVLFLFGENWIEVSPLLQFTLLGNALVVALPNADQLLIAHGKVTRLFYMRAIPAVLTVALFVIAASYGMTAIGIAFVVGGLLQVLSISLAIRSVGIDLLTLMIRLVPGAVVTLISAVPTTYLLFSSTTEAPMLMVFLSFLGGGVLWLCCVLLIRNDLGDEIRNAATALRQSRHKA